MKIEIDTRGKQNEASHVYINKGLVLCYPDGNIIQLKNLSDFLKRNG
ncbi:hypothetical protein HMPREF1982_03906 [Clostridiales bacterium oral taxon 876 str. F0540]|nr:hypothetical protein HMPREF1982_03906 [Clostridiales bacterium oral taxon 876 str. F0540]